MINNLLKDKIQKEALAKWIENNKKGTAEITTGIGKTILALHALYTMDKDDTIHLFLAETTEREKDLLKDIELYNKLFNVNVLKDYNLKFYCYQTVYKWEKGDFGLIIADEIHDSLSPAYSKFYFNNNYKAILGLSATVDKNKKYITDNNSFTKGDLLKKISPIIYTYSINDGKKDGVSRNLNIYIINQELDNVNKNVQAGSIRNRFFQTEKSSYEFWDKQHKQAWYIEDIEQKNLRIRITATKRSNLLFNLPSKILAVQQLINILCGKTILFGNSVDSLLKITKNVISSRNNDVENDLIRDNFDSNKISLIGSFKKLKQGANLKDLDNCILMSYYSTEKDIVQRVNKPALYKRF